MTIRLASLWLRLELRRRWPQLVVLALLVAISSATVLATTAGARRGATSTARLAERTLPATAIVRANTEEISTVGGWTAIRALPEVAAVSVFNGYTGFGVDEAPASPVQVYIPVDDEAMRTVERPVVLAGRLLDPARPDEAVVTAAFVRTYRLGVGARVHVRMFSPSQVGQGISAVRNLPLPNPDGPVTQVRIVGVIRSSWFSDQVGEPGRLIPSPALAKAHPRSIVDATAVDATDVQWGLVRLRHGEADLPKLRAYVAGYQPWPYAEVIARSPELDHARDVVRFEAAWLLAFSGVALLVAVIMVSQVIARIAAAATPDLRALNALGMTRRQGTLAVAAGPLLACAVGTLLGAAVAVAVSVLLPIGVAADWDPSPGVDVDRLVLPLGRSLSWCCSAC